MAGETELERLVVRLRADVEGYIQPLQEAVEESKKAASEIEQYTQQTAAFASSLISFGTSLSVGVTAPLIAMATAATYAFGIQEAEEIKLRGILEANERQVESLFEDYATFASALQQVTITGNETTFGMLRTAESLGVTGEAAKTAIKEAMGLAAAIGMTERGAIRYTAMLAQGDTMMLQRYIPTLRKFEDENERVAEAHRMLARMFAVAEAEAIPFSGQLKQLWNDTGDLMEQFGKIIATALLPFVKLLKAIVLQVQALPEPLKVVIVGFAAVAAAIGPALIALGAFIHLTLFAAAGLKAMSLAAMVSTIRIVAYTVAVNLASIATAVFNAVSSPITLVIVAVTAAVAGVSYVLYRLQKDFGVFTPIIEAFSSAWEILKTEIAFLWRQIADHLTPAMAPLMDTLRQLWSVLGLATKGLVEFLTPLLEVGLILGVKALALAIETHIIPAIEKIQRLVNLLDKAAKQSGMSSLMLGLKLAGIAMGAAGKAPVGAGAPGDAGAPGGGKAKELIDEARSLAEAYIKDLSALDDQLLQLKMTEEDYFAMKQFEMGRTEEEVELLRSKFRELKNIEKQQKDLKDAEQEWQRIEDKGRQLIEQYMTPLEKYTKQAKDLLQLRRLNAIDEATFTRAMIDAENQLAATKEKSQEAFVSQGVEAIRRGSVQEAILKQEHRIAVSGGAASADEENRRNLAGINENTSREALENVIRSGIEAARQPGDIPVNAGLAGIA